MSMRILDRYIGRSVALSTALVMGVLLTLFTFFAFMDEVGSIGKGHYGTQEALLYALLTVPGLAYQLFPMAALLGSTIGLGMLASNSELVVMRAAGVSLRRIIGSVMKVGLVLVILTLVVGEGIAPEAERYAQTLRSVAMSDKLTLRGQNGLWARDGESFINVREILPGERLGQIYIFERDGAFRLSRLIQAQSAVYRRGHWLLEGVVQSDISDQGVSSKRLAQAPWKTSLSPDLLNVVTVRPNTLSIVGLFQYVNYLRGNGLDASTYEQALWGKLVTPLVTAVMVFISIPFVFGPLRSVSVGHRVLIGTLVGVGFHIVNQMFAYMGLVFALNPMVSASLPAIIAFSLAYWMLRKVR